VTHYEQDKHAAGRSENRRSGLPGHHRAVDDRRAWVRAAADAAELAGADRVVDVGCGPGIAVRLAARRAAAATGVDPDPAMLRFAPWSTAIPRPPQPRRSLRGVAAPPDMGRRSPACAARAARRRDRRPLSPPGPPDTLGGQRQSLGLRDPPIGAKIGSGS
jgi:SAM-dependent methyltransferase